MHYHTAVPDSIRRRYSVKVTTVLAALACSTLAATAVLATHALAAVESGSDAGATVTAAFAGVGLLVALHLGLAAVLLGPSVASAAERLARAATEAGGRDAVDVETDRVDEIGRAYDAVETTSRTLQSRVDQLEAERAEARETARTTEGQNEELVAEARRFGEVMAACAEGDLTQRLNAQTDNEALRAIAASFNRMLSELERTVLQVQRFTDVVDDASGELQASAQEISDASEAVSASVQEISEGSTSQTEDLEQAAAEVKELSATIEEVAATTSTIAEASAEVATLAEDGTAAASTAAAEMAEAEDRTDTVASTIGRLNDDVERIDEAVSLIDDIAHQTNMLALNAAIETARTDQGQQADAGGFDVVADEVQDLSAEIQAAVDEIQGTIDAIQEQSSASAEEIQAVEEHVGRASETVEALEAELSTMTERIGRVDDSVQEIDRTTNDQAGTVEQLAGLIENVAVVSAQTSEQADRVAGSSAETAEEIGEVSAKARSLDSQADRLTDVVGQFDVSSRQQLADSATGEATDGGEPRDVPASELLWDAEPESRGGDSQ